jgi:uncharacterized protein (TIGR00369 family)
MPPVTEPSLITADDFIEVLRLGMPSAQAIPFTVVTLERGLAVLRLVPGAAALRPGGSIAGPVLFWFADLAMYAAVMTAIGKVPLAVTTDATIHFLRLPKAGALVARASLLKVGKRLVVGDVRISEDGGDDPLVAHAAMTYSVPPR